MNHEMVVKPKLLIVSDLWGVEKSEWIEFYTSKLTHHFEIEYVDSCELGNVSKATYLEENLHKQFVNGGIEIAADNLVRQENSEELTVLAFSVGGVIAWKAWLCGLNVKSLFAISSSRLRNEIEKPIGIIKLIYGENDQYQPSAEWFDKMNVESVMIKNEAHDCYTTKEIADNICEMMVNQVAE
jgi:hypothetical protein